MARDMVAKYGQPRVGMKVFPADRVRKAEAVVYGTRIGMVVAGLAVLGLLYAVAPGFAIGVALTTGFSLGVWGLVMGTIKLKKAYKDSRVIISHARDYGVKDE